MRNYNKKMDETKIFKEILTQFVTEEDPLLSMLKPKFCIRISKDLANALVMGVCKNLEVNP